MTNSEEIFNFFTLLTHPIFTNQSYNSFIGKYTLMMHFLSALNMNFLYRISEEKRNHTPLTKHFYEQHGAIVSVLDVFAGINTIFRMHGTPAAYTNKQLSSIKLTIIA